MGSPALNAGSPRNLAKLAEASADCRLEALLIGPFAEQDGYPGEVPNGHPAAGESAGPKSGKRKNREDRLRLTA